MPETQGRWLWYERTWFVIVALVVFWPIGLALMWAQRKFSPAMRAGLSIAIPALSAMALAGILLLPRGASPAKPAPAVVGETSAAVAATGSAPTTGSQAASSTTSTTATSSKQGGTKKSGGTTTPGRTTAPPANTQPAPPANPTGSARFTMTGAVRTTSAGTSRVSIALRAASAKGATKYVWWVTTVDSSTSYSGQSVSLSYYGLPPSRIQLVAYYAKGAPTSWEADVVSNGGQLSATGR